VADLSHTANRVVDQRPDIVHHRLLELADRLRDELPPIEPGTQAASILGITGRLPVQVRDLGAERIELRTTDGRIRGESVATIQPAAGDRTALGLSIVVKPQGFAANLMFGAGLQMAGGQQKIVASLEKIVDDLVIELEKPDGAWDPRSWMPSGLAG